MKQVCLHCTREAPAGTLWCQEATCATGDKPLVLESGESLGDINVARVLAVLSTATVYEAIRGGETVLLKVAHHGCEERLKREAIFLASLHGRTFHAALPHLLPAYAQTEVRTYPYGKVVSQGQTFCYTVLVWTNGKLLRDILLQRPQPWYQHAGWLVLSVANALALMHQQQRLHLCLSPESLLVRYDREQIPRPLLLDLGAVTPPEEMRQNWQPSYVLPAYVAPELLGRSGSKYGAFTDVYGLGLLLYEMLSGSAAYSFRLRTDGEIHEDVLSTPPAPLNRPDLKVLPDIVNRAISKDYRHRPPHVLALAQELQTTLPPVPREKQERRINWRTVAVVLGAVLAVTLLLALALSLGQP
jgi:serine/threonine protein kinase